LVAEWFVRVFTLYAIAGLVFGAAFVAGGVSRVDEHAEGARWGFRLIILPGVAALWPLLLHRWLRATSRVRP
jgi:hypothetical protein